jgi:hypothetical protein
MRSHFTEPEPDQTRGRGRGRGRTVAMVAGIVMLAALTAVPALAYDAAGSDQPADTLIDVGVQSWGSAEVVANGQQADYVQFKAAAGETVTASTTTDWLWEPYTGPGCWALTGWSVYNNDARVGSLPASTEVSYTIPEGVYSVALYPDYEGDESCRGYFDQNLARIAAGQEQLPAPPRPGS